MQTVELTGDAVAAADAAIPADTAVYMVNLLRFRDRADYGDRTDIAPCSGQEAYLQRYVPAFDRVADGAGTEIVWLGAVLAGLIAPPDERWHVAAIVRYPDVATFRRIVEDPAYLAEAEPHRSAALEDSRLIAAARMGLPA